MNDEDAAQFKIDLNALWNSTQGGFLKFNLSNCHQLTIIGRSKRTASSYRIDCDKSLTSVEYEKDLGLGVDSRISFNEDIAKTLKKANSLVAKIREVILNITKDVLSTLYKAIVTPRQEYANQTWNPYQKMHKIFIDNIHLRATKLIPHLNGRSYSERVNILNHPTLEFERRRGRMIEALKNVKEFCDPAVTGDIFRMNE